MRNPLFTPDYRIAAWVQFFALQAEISAGISNMGSTSRRFRRKELAKYDAHAIRFPLRNVNAVRRREAMQEQHLRPVPSAESETDQSSPSPDADNGGEQKRSKRPRSERALPTDRLKIDAQKAALQAIAVASDYGKKAVGSNDIAPRMGVAPSTASLNNNFFRESGLIKRESKGKYLPTEAVNSFARTYSFNKQEAGADLKQVLSKAWYFEEVQKQLGGMGPATKDTLVELLAHRAGASQEHESQLAALLTWLEYARLIEIDGSLYKLAKDLPDEQPGEDSAIEPEKKEVSATPEGSTSTKEEGGVERAQPVLSFSFDISLTKEDLQGLSAEQIRAVFEAVGTVMAIKTAQ
jgi:hypothetical protein